LQLAGHCITHMITIRYPAADVFIPLVVVDLISRSALIQYSCSCHCSKAAIVSMKISFDRKESKFRKVHQLYMYRD